ncbi:replisome organizer [Lactococcus hircilactis]|uniref:Replisome organizer n=1 Tax=Lactococcus hircilactis TaxID=1494462 RepID=A0A7X2D2K2_9LACT|nr:phage replisome organiser protein [Lactococcus hircilactis]MQW40165.1 replisome organizer [Lactococcus hircilactis]
MAQRRMFSKKIVETDLFMEMSPTAKLLYFYLNMGADDDGFVGNPKTIKMISGATDDDLKILIAKQFIIPFESGVIVIKDWKIHNYIQKDRYNQTQYIKEKNQLLVEENGSYTKCIQNVSMLDTQVRLGKESLGKESKEIEREENIDEKFARYFSIFHQFARKNGNKRAMALQEFMTLPPFQKDEAIIGAENYVKFYVLDNPDDKTHQYSVNAYEFIKNALFGDYQEMPEVKKVAKKKKWI